MWFSWCFVSSHDCFSGTTSLVSAVVTGIAGRGVRRAESEYMDKNF